MHNSMHSMPVEQIEGFRCICKTLWYRSTCATEGAVRKDHVDVGCLHPVLDSIVVSIPACHAGDRGSIPRRGGWSFFKEASSIEAI